MDIKVLKKQLKEKTDAEPDKYYPTGVLKEKGFSRKKCAGCGMFFWSLNDDSVCGEPECGSRYSFIGNPSGRKMSFVDVWKSFEGFFENEGYKSIKRYPVAARWRDDTDFVQASIYNFQPHVVSGASKPPANPLVVPQYCLRFNEVENVGITGRHNTGFVMIGQHAFTKSDEYEQDKYFKDLFEWFVEEMKIPAEELKIHESQWAGGGNLGVSMEFFAKGLELGNQVYMLYKVIEEGYEPLDLKVLDMGMGQGRIAWLVNGTRTMYESEYPKVCSRLFEATGVLPSELFEKFIPYGSVLDIDASDKEQLERMWDEISSELGASEKELKECIMHLSAVYSIADHAQSLLFALADGVLPSNTGGGYNLRAILRRSLSFIYEYGWNVKLSDVCEWHAEEWKEQYPELEGSLPDVRKILEYEERKYKETLGKARKKVEAMIQKTNEIDFETLLKLYESDGITPELIKEIAKKEEIEVSLPKDFYSKVSSFHETSVKKKETVEFDVSEVRETEKLYYNEVSEFQAYVLKSWDENGKRLVALDKTAFYPESGGQDFDTGFIGNFRVVNVQKQGNVVIHELESGSFQRGSLVNCRIDTERREQLKKHHTATHIINGAAKKVLGNHIWQAGAEKKQDRARLDITHYELPSDSQLEMIEELSNKVISESRPVSKEVYSRSEAEQKYGFRLYQGGAIPSDEIRVVDIKDWDTEACGGTHADSTSEVEEIRILKARKIQDGVVRLEFIAGKEKIREFTEKSAEKDKKKKTELAKKIISLNSSLDLRGKSAEELEEIYVNEIKKHRKSLKTAADEIDVSEDAVFLEDVDFKTMQEAGRKKVKENPESFSVIISSKGQVFGIRGNDCPVDVENLVKAACETLGGKYGVKENEFTGGGPLKDKSKEACQKVKTLLE